MQSNKTMKMMWFPGRVWKPDPPGEACIVALPSPQSTHGTHPPVHSWPLLGCGCPYSNSSLWHWFLRGDYLLVSPGSFPLQSANSIDSQRKRLGSSFPHSGSGLCMVLVSKWGPPLVEASFL